jgi:hypothetical protein
MANSKKTTEKQKASAAKKAQQKLLKQLAKQAKKFQDQAQKNFRKAFQIPRQQPAQKPAIKQRAGVSKVDGTRQFIPADGVGLAAAIKREAIVDLPSHGGNIGEHPVTSGTASVSPRPLDRPSGVPYADSLAAMNRG